MADILNVDLDALYRAWRLYMKEHSNAKYFGVDNDLTKAKFPYANFQMVGRPTNTSDLENHEITVDLTIQTDCYIDKQNLQNCTKWTMRVGVSSRNWALGEWATAQSQMCRT